MNILGLTILWHDVGACLISDGRIKGIIEEERFTRQKHHYGTFDPVTIPDKSINRLLADNGLTIDDIDAVAVNYSPEEGMKWRTKRHNIIKNYAWNYAKNKHIEMDVQRRFPGKKVIFCEHHLAHAYSAVFGSGFDDTAFISIDGGGENASIYIGLYRDGELSVIEKFENSRSVGFLYEYIADYLIALSVGEGAGKLMGLAPYGDPARFYDIFEDIFEFDDAGSFRTKIDLNFPGSDELENYMKKHFKYRQKDEDAVNGYFEDIAAAAQKITEYVLVRLARRALEKTGSENLCLAGGVGLNAKANFEIIRQTPIKEENFYIAPQSNDAGGACGAAYYAHMMHSDTKPEAMQHCYWGTEYSDEFIRAQLNKFGVKYTGLSSSAEVTDKGAELLAKGYVIGWYQGRMEIGPRALGNRSILMNPSLEDGKDKMNLKIKNREYWRPFALSILDTHADKYLQTLRNVPFMIVIDNVMPEYKDALQAGVHIDGTTRPQVVTREMNEKYYALIEKFGELTGVYSVLNTSFNLAGEPIVETPAQAVADFFTSGMDALIIGSFLLEK